VNKDLIVDVIRNRLRSELRTLETVATNAHKAATNSELQPDGKYDTQAIEAGYLAGAQARRVEELRSDLAKIESLKSAFNTTNATVGSLVQMEDLGSYFISPTSGGSTIEIEGVNIKVVSNSSPIGKELLGLECGDGVEISTPSGTKEFTIKAIE